MDPRELYGLPLDRFVPERTALVKELRRSGKREQAEAVRALRKPSLAAWAVNQLVRTQRRDIGALFKAGDAARRAQAKLLAGRGDGAALREALDTERAAVDGLTQAAQGLLSSEGHELSPAMLERVADTLHAAALEEEARAEVKGGCLDRELRHVGLGVAGLSGGATAEPKSSSQPKPKPTAPPRRELRRREAEARRAAERAARDLEAAQARQAAAAGEVAEAKATVAEAQRRLRETQTAHRRAERELDRA